MMRGRMMFPLGKPLLVMTILGSLCGIVICFRAPSEHKDLTLWIFAESHRREFTPVLPAFTAETGMTVDLKLQSSRAMYVRLVSLFMTGARGYPVPDAVHVEIQQVGKFFRPPLEGVGLRPLNSYLEERGAREIADPSAPGQAGWHARLAGTTRILTHDGERWHEDPTRTKPDMWIDRIIRTRFAPWTKQGVIFGVPQDVHTVTITYRDDLFREAGIDLSQADTWPKFHDSCLRLQAHWAASGITGRHAMQLSESGSDKLSLMLLQRGINLVDDYNRIHLADQKVAETMAFFAGMVAGPRQIGYQSSGSYAVLADELDKGDLACCFTADWSIAYLHIYAKPSLQGKLRLMALPVFDIGDAPTSTWGGTMIGIPKGTDHPEEAWKLIEHLYLSPVGMEGRLKESVVLPPLKEFWGHPHLHEADPLYGGQHVGELLISLAERIPPRYVTPSTNLAQAQLSDVLARAVDQLKYSGPDGLVDQCQEWLDAAALDVAARINHQRFER
jgi:arabinosaccharide transport system substrate-binding protein